MKKLLIVLGICAVLITTSASACDCDTSERPITGERTNTSRLSSNDIAALQQQGEREGWTFTVSENPATKRSFDELYSLKEPENWWVDAPFDPCTPTSDLPETFDWRELDGCTPIKDQSQCGSCWAFATVGPLECNIKIKDKKTVDLSEQWLVSCNRDGWSCNGGWFAHNYHMSKTDPCGGTGAILEDEFPYVAYNAPCNCPYTHKYLINDWAYIGTEYGVPSIDAIKQAIMDYGPVSVAVYVNSAFAAYDSGVFNQSSSGQVNHGVVLVGWDDNQGDNGVWFLRNSWGEWWGEEGYMRIAYGCCKIGYAACYVDYLGGVPTTDLSINITGGSGVTVDIKNSGEENDATNPTWNISVIGGFFHFINISQGNSASLLAPGTSTQEKVRPFGLGPITITVTAEAVNADKVTKIANAFILFRFCILKPS